MWHKLYNRKTLIWFGRHRVVCDGGSVRKADLPYGVTGDRGGVRDKEKTVGGI